MDTHPYNAPMCYVKPTSDMQIKASMFVDHNGKIYLPYLHDWVPVSNVFLDSLEVPVGKLLHFGIARRLSYERDA